MAVSEKFASVYASAPAPVTSLGCIGSANRFGYLDGQSEGGACVTTDYEQAAETPCLAQVVTLR